MDEGMDGWWLSYFFVELLLRWATSSLRYLFSQLLLLWTASYVGYFFCDPCSQLPPSSFCNPILLLALAAPNASAFSDFYVKSSSRYSLVHILPTSSSKSARNASVVSHFEVQIELSLKSCALFVDNFPRSNCNRGNRGPASATRGATLPEKTLGFPPKSVFTHEFTRSRTVTLRNCSPTRAACSQCYWYWWWWWWWWWWWKNKIELSLQSRAHWANSQILQIHARVPSVSVGIFQFSKMLTNLGVVKPVKSVLLSSRSLLLI